MEHQPHEQWTSPCDNNQYTTLETVQFLPPSFSNRKNPFTFSPVINISDEPSSSCPFNNVQSFNTEEVENKIDGIIDNKQLNFEDMIFMDNEDLLDQELDTIDLKHIDDSIPARIMSVEIQPPTNIRRRYQIDGKRQIEKSRSKPMSVNLPNLQELQLKPNQSFWIQLTLITYSKNPTDKVYIHVDKLEYHADDLPECDHGFVRVPLTQMDIEKGIKQFARISVIKTKLDSYTLKLISFNPLTTDNQTEFYENDKVKTLVAKAKCFRDKYNLTSSRIACQLLIKQNETWYMTNIQCQTNIMEEKEKQKKSTKRSISANNSDDDEEQEKPQVHHPTSVKRRKRSPSLIKSLPVVRVTRQNKQRISQ